MDFRINKGKDKSEVYNEVKDVELCRIWKRKQI